MRLRSMNKSGRKIFFVGGQEGSMHMCADLQVGRFLFQFVACGEQPQAIGLILSGPLATKSCVELVLALL